MLTTNFKHAMAMVLEALSTGYKGLLPVVAYDATQYWITGGGLSNLLSPTRNLTLSLSAAGVVVGTGDTPPTVDDYKLEAQITANLTGTTIQSTGQDIEGNPYLNIDLTLHNSGAETVTIREIGYRQGFNTATVQGTTTSSTTRYLLIDRTVLDEPVVIPAGENGIIRYTLKTIVA